MFYKDLVMQITDGLEDLLNLLVSGVLLDPLLKEFRSNVVFLADNLVPLLSVLLYLWFDVFKESWC